MPNTTLRRPDGSVFLQIDRAANNRWIHARWYGPQTLGSVMEGGLLYIDMLRAHPCPALLNDHSALHGLFTGANDWIAQVWTPMIMQAGLHYFAQVLSPDVFAQFSMENLHQRIGPNFQMRMFDNVPAARAWLEAQVV